MRMTKTTRDIMLTMVAASGLAIAAPALSALRGQDAGQGSLQASDHDQKTVYAFQSADVLLGQTIRNPQGDELATIDDLVLNRGTGRVEAVVIREGGFLGFGGSHVAVPYDAFRLDQSSLKLTLNASPNMLEEGDTVLPSGWQRLEDGWTEDLSGLLATQRILMRQLPAVDSDTETTAVRGTIAEIQRIDLGEHQHWLAVQIGESEAGAARDGRWVVLGPAWYVSGGVRAPVRGQQIEVETFEGHGDKLHAKTASIEGELVRYRDDAMEPMWTNRAMRSASERNPGPMVLLTNVLDERLVWGRSDDEVGEVTNAVFELTTGHLAVLAIDPRGERWGQDAGPRAVPFDVARVGEDEITLDASAEMLGGAEVLPDDVRSMTMPRTREAVFAVFEVQPPEYSGRR